MARGFYKALNIESGEESSVLLLIFQSVFLGIFIGAFDIGAHSLFLEVYDQAMVPRAFLISGLFGIVMTSIYAWLQSRIRFSVFSILNLMMVAAVTVFLRVAFGVFKSDWVIFAVFVMMGPLNLVGLLGFWGTVGRIFTLRQGKRLFGLIDTGQIMGIILSSYAIPVLLSFAVETRDLLYISACSVVIALVFQFIISGRYSMVAPETEQDSDSRKEASLGAMFRSRYIGYMSLFVFLLISVTFFVHFSYLGVAQQAYPDHNDLAAFFGYFNGTLMVFSILIKTFVFGRVMKTWGLKLALVISPIMIAIFTIVAAVIGGVFGLAGSFTIFFLVISVSKLFTKSLQDSIVAPSMKILYQSLEAKIRYGVQARIDGTINEISVLITSLLAAGLVSLAFFTLVDYSYVLILLLFAWALVSFRLYRAYQNSLNSSLAKFRQSEAGLKSSGMKEILNRDLESPDITTIRNALGIYEATDFAGFRSALSELLKSASEQIRKLSMNRIRELKLPIVGDEFRVLEKDPEGSNKDLAGLLVGGLSPAGKKNPSVEDLLELAKSVDISDRENAALLLFNQKEFRHHVVLNTLLRDPDPAIRSNAIQVAAFWKVTEASPILIDLLDTELFRLAFDALVRIGDLESLEQSYFKSGISGQSLRRITRIIGRVGTKEAIKSLVGKLNYQDRVIESIALEALPALGYRADQAGMQKIIDGIRSSVYQIAWNMAAQNTILEHKLGEYLEYAIQEELSVSFDRMYDLLSIAYDPNSIHHIRQNLESGTSEGIGFAIELLDIFVTDEVKPVLFPVLEDTGTSEKIRQLQTEFPIVILQPYELLLSMINRDPNLLGAYTKAAAIHALSDFEETEASDDLVAQIFNPDVLLSELAAVQIRRLDSSLYESAMERLPAGQKKRLTLSTREENNLVWDRINLLRNSEFLAGLPTNILYILAAELELVYLKPGENYPMVREGNRRVMGILRAGSARLFIDENEIERISGIFGVPALIRTESVWLTADSETLILVAGQDFVEAMMFDYDQLALAVYRWTETQRDKLTEQNTEMVS